ncbi:ribonuclease H-like domain-containing protein, partial [Tanacetum coccineum]
RVIQSLHSEFAMTDLGSLNYFLGISTQRTSASMFLTQSKYVEGLRERADMLHYNPCQTPMDTKSKLGPHGDPVFDPTLYRSLDGGLQYLTFTHPDISYAILHYIHDTIDHGIELHVPSMTQLTTYTDATG